MDLIEKALFGFLFSILGFIAFIIVDVFCGNFVYYNGTVIDKHYEPEQTSSGVGSAIATNGQVGIVSTFDHESEKFLLMVKKQNGEIVTTESEPEIYYQKKIGDVVVCKAYIGKWSIVDWTNETIK